MKYIFFKKKAGFTLMEIMMVIMIIGILSIVLYPHISGYFSRARDTKKKSELQELNTAVITRFYDINTLIIPGVGYRNNGEGWVNFKHPENFINPNYHKSIAQGFQEWWYLRKSFETIERDYTLFSSFWSNYPCASPIHNIDLYMYYADDIHMKYSLSTSLEHAKPEDIAHIQTLHNGMWPNGICERYGKNYGIWN